MQATTSIVRVMVRGISGMRPAPALTQHMPSSPTLLIACGATDDIAVNRGYAETAANAQLWEIPEAGHTGGLRARPAEYERRVIDFLDYASTG